MASSPGYISTANKLLFAAPAFALAAAGFFNSAFLTKFYVDDLRMKPDIFALMFALVRSLDMLGMPVLGWLVDSSFFYAPPWLVGRRKPMLLLTVPFVASGLFLLYSPPSYLDPWELSAWYCVVASIYYFLPLVTTYNSLGAELSTEYDERTQIFGYVHVLACLGMVAAALAPGIISWATEVPHTFSFPLFALVIAVLEVLSVAALAFNVRVVDPVSKAGSRAASIGWLWEQTVHLPQDVLSTLTRRRYLATAQPQAEVAFPDKSASGAASVIGARDTTVNGTEQPMRRRIGLWSSCVFTCGVARRGNRAETPKPSRTTDTVEEESLYAEHAQSLYGRVMPDDWTVVRVPILHGTPENKRTQSRSDCCSCIARVRDTIAAARSAVVEVLCCVSCRCCCGMRKPPSSAVVAVRLSALRAAAQRVGYDATSLSLSPPFKDREDIWVVCLPAVSAAAVRAVTGAGAAGRTFCSVDECGVRGMVDAVCEIPHAHRSADSDRTSRIEGTSLEQALPLIPGVAWALASLPMRVYLALTATRVVASLCSMSFVAFYVQYVLQPQKYELW
jgi:hypothetical protein